jgi:hypothetical protein
VRGVHRFGRTDRTLLWGTAALIAFTLGAVAITRTHGGPVAGADDSRLCYNSAGVGAACLPPAGGFEDVAVPPGPPTTPTTPTMPVPAPSVTRATTPATRPPTRPPTSRPPASKKSRPAWAAGVAYAEGAQVAYQGGVYACLQPHTSQVDWSPVAAPALWSRVS